MYVSFSPTFTVLSCIALSCEDSKLTHNSLAGSSGTPADSPPKKYGHTSPQIPLPSIISDTTGQSKSQVVGMELLPLTHAGSSPNELMQVGSSSNQLHQTSNSDFSPQLPRLRPYPLPITFRACPCDSGTTSIARRPSAF